MKSKTVTVVLYWNPNYRWSRASDSIWMGEHIIGQVRPENHKGQSLSEALEKAKPRKGEVVLNSVSVTLS